MEDLKIQHISCCDRGLNFVLTAVGRATSRMLRRPTSKNFLLEIVVDGRRLLSASQIHSLELLRGEMATFGSIRRNTNYSMRWRVVSYCKV